MKKFIFSLIIAAFASLTLLAGPVDKDTAAQIASRFLSSEVSLITDGSDGLYIFNAADGNGWVIVSAEDSAMPILGYSDRGSFRTDNQPSNLRAWMGGIQSRTAECLPAAHRPKQRSQSSLEDRRLPHKVSRRQIP